MLSIAEKKNVKSMHWTEGWKELGCPGATYIERKETFRSEEDAIHECHDLINGDMERTGTDE